MLYFPERMWEGDLPNVDFPTPLRSGRLHVLMGWYERSDSRSVPSGRSACCSTSGSSSVLRHRSRVGPRGSPAVATLSTLLILPRSASRDGVERRLALTLWSAVLGVRAMHLHEPEARRNTWIAAGVLAGLALTYRPDLVVAVGLVFAWLRVATTAPHGDR